MPQVPQTTAADTGDDRHAQAEHHDGGQEQEQEQEEVIPTAREEPRRPSVQERFGAMGFNPLVGPGGGYRPPGAVPTAITMGRPPSLTRQPSSKSTPEEGGVEVEDQEGATQHRIKNPYQLDAREGGTVEASFPFKGNKDLLQLAFGIADSIKILRKDENWSWGRNERTQEEGFFPHNYVQSTFQPLPGMHELAAKIARQRQKQEAAESGKVDVGVNATEGDDAVISSAENPAPNPEHLTMEAREDEGQQGHGKSDSAAQTESDLPEGSPAAKEDDKKDSEIEDGDQPVLPPFNPAILSKAPVSSEEAELARKLAEEEAAEAKAAEDERLLLLEAEAKKKKEEEEEEAAAEAMKRAEAASAMKGQAQGLKGGVHGSATEELQEVSLSPEPREAQAPQATAGRVPAIQGAGNQPELKAGCRCSLQ
jgi:hypothetical protein